MPLLRNSLARLAACADRLAAGDSAQPDRAAVAQYMDALDLAIGRCVALPAFGCWLDVLCPLKENLQPLCKYLQSGGPDRVDPRLVTSAVVLTYLARSLERQPDALVCEVVLDVMGTSVWPWPLPPSARPALRTAFGLPASYEPRQPERQPAAHHADESLIA